MNQNDVKDNIYGTSIILKIIVSIFSVLSIPMFIYLFIRSIFEIETFGEHKYLLIIPIIMLLLNIYCILFTIKYKILYYNKTIILEFVIFNKTINLNEYKYFKNDFKTLPVSYLLFKENKEKKIRIHFWYSKRELFYKYLINILEEIK